MSQIADQIPLYDADEHLLRFVGLDHVWEHRAHFRLITTRRGHVKRAYFKGRSLPLDFRPASTLGIGFEQPVSTGHVWALSGVTGSR